MSKGLWSRKKFTSVVMDPGDIKYCLNLFFNFFIHFTYEPKCPPPLHSFPFTSHLLFRDVKASHWESTMPGLLSWGRTKALLFASRLARYPTMGNGLQKAYSRIRHINHGPTARKTHNCHPTFRRPILGLCRLPNCEFRFHEVPLGPVRCSVDFPFMILTTPPPSLFLLLMWSFLPLFNCTSLALPSTWLWISESASSYWMKMLWQLG